MSFKPFTISLMTLLMTITLVYAIARRGEPLVIKTNLENLPMEIGGFMATEDYFPDSVYKELNADKHVYRHYKSSTGSQVDLYIGYYGTAKGGRTAHNPFGCLPGSGWGIEESELINLQGNTSAESITVNYILARKGDTYETVLHWYQTEGTKVISTGIQANIQRFLGRIFKNRNDGAFVRISAMSDQNGLGQANARVKFFAKNILNLLPHYWPIEK